MGRRARSVVIGLILFAIAGAAAGDESARVVWVSDGDTITVRIGSVKEKVRLIGIDTPELGDARHWWRDLAFEARDYARKRVKGRTVTLTRDPAVDDRDKYGRLLRYVILDDGTNFNEEMIRRGYAAAYTRFRFSLASRFKATEKEARRERLGRWATPS